MSVPGRDARSWRAVALTRPEALTPAAAQMALAGAQHQDGVKQGLKEVLDLLGSPGCPLEMNTEVLF